jgi:predicted secreted Zn-dependent protease
MKTLLATVVGLLSIASFGCGTTKDTGITNVPGSGVSRFAPIESTPILDQAQLAPTPDWSIPYVPPIKGPSQAPLNVAPQASGGTVGLLACYLPANEAIASPIAQNQILKGTKTTLTIKVLRRKFVIQGCTANDLFASAVQNGPRNPDERTIALTSWGMTINYLLDQKPSGCSISRAMVLLTITTALPEPGTFDGIFAPERAKWDQYLAATKAHEQHHIDIDTLGAKRLQAALEQMRPSPTCDLLEHSIRAEKDRIETEVRQENRDFDFEDR